MRNALLPLPLGSMALWLAAKRWAPRVPGTHVVVLATAAAELFAIRRTSYRLGLLTLFGVLMLGIVQGMLIAVLHELLDGLDQRRVRCVIGRGNVPVISTTYRAGLVDRIDAEDMVGTVRAGVYGFDERE